MAYPNRIAPTGALDQAEMLDYFKGALLDSITRNTNPESWPYFYDSNLADEPFLSTPPSLPFTRQVFYNWIDYWTDNPPLVNDQGTLYGFSTINGAKLYTFAEVQTGWPIDAVNDWGKIKTLELGIFGSVGNGSSLTSNSIIGTGTVISRIPQISRSDLTYLRYGLTRFDSYGACHPEENNNPAPTSPVVNVSNRTFNWTNAPGFTSVSNYEYSINGGGWITASSKPINIPEGGVIPVGGFLLRTRGQGYISPSITIQNNTAYPGTPIVVFLLVSPSGSNISLSVSSLALSKPVTYSVTINNNYQIINDSITVPAEEMFVTKNISTGGQPVINPFIQNASANPSIVDGRPIQLNYS